ncbi:MAG TPA: DUF4175 family protein [Bacteroidia bacterium]|nr:DUF4175 family protein [Bacteroidia bacterium]
MASNYDILIQKLDEFIRKFYKNQLLRGLIYSFTTLLAFYLLVTTFEYFGHFNSAARTVLFYLFVLTNVFIIGKLIVIPVLKLNKLGKIISHQQAAEIIGRHFNNVSDKLLNTLQLKEQSEVSSPNAALIEAGINQKISQLKPVPFAAAIDLRKNLRYLRYAIVPFAVLIVILFAAPSLLKDGTQRLIHHATYFEKPSPFTFTILNKDLKVIQQEDFLLNIKVDGKEIPENVYIQIGENQFKLDKENTVNFNYKFKNVQQNQTFELLADGYNSREYELISLPNPVILNFNISLQYPVYVNRQNEQLKNTGDMIIPAGTKVRWDFNTQNTALLNMNFQDTSVAVKQTGENEFSINRSFVKSNSYSVVTANNQLRGKDSMLYNINVIPDLYPSIKADQQIDSASTQKIYFQGMIKDDYGFTRLNFCYRFLKTSDSIQRDEKPVFENIAINRNSNQDQFFYFWDLTKMNINAGEELEYYFEIWDNDGVTGAKSTRSQSNIFKAPTEKELAENTEKNNNKLKDDLKESIEQAKKLQKDISEASKKMLEKKNLNYDDKKKIEDLLKQQRDLEEKTKQIQQQNKQNTQKESEYKNQMSEIAEKQKQLEELFDKVMSDEMKKMMEELQQLLSELDKEKIQEMMDKMKLDNKDLEKRLDRTLELFKQLEVEQKIKEDIKALDELAKEQNKLSEKSQEKNADAKDLQEKQKDLNKKFDDLAKDLKDIEKKNAELEFPQELSNTDKEQEDIKQDMQQSEQQLSQNQKKSASKKQKSAAEKMEEMSQKMKQEQQQEEMEQQEEDLNALRALLENLIRFSFNQEALMQDLKTMDINNPQYLKLSQQQRKLKDDAKVMEDSLLALSKRVIQIQSIVNEQMTIINDNIAKSIDHLQDRLVPVARSEQQYVMTSVNNLALMLSEAMDQMQQQMQSMKTGGQCKKPGKGKPSSAAQLRKMQEQLNEQMKQMKGKKDGKGKPGEKPGQNMSEELARMAAQQEAIRNELSKMSNEENKEGKGSQGNLGQMQLKMEETEKDLVNKRLTEETLKRNEEILTRLLESEKAERQRDQDEKRESNEAKDKDYRNQAQFEEYKKLKMREMELLKTIPPSLNPFYKNLVNYYFQNLESN